MSVILNPQEPIEIILVEDEKDLLQGMSLSFQVAGFAPRTFFDGKDAKDYLLQLSGAPNAVLVADICLPNVSGIELIEIFKKKFPHLPAVAITGFGDKEMLTALLRAKCDEFVDKPFELPELVALVQRASEVQQKRNQEAIILLRSLPSMREFFSYYTVAGDNRRDLQSLQSSLRGDTPPPPSPDESIRVQRLSSMARVQILREWAGPVSEQAVKVFEQLLTSGIRHLELDLALVNDVDSLALATICSLAAELQDARGTLSLLNVQPSVRSLVEHTRLEKNFFLLT